MASTPPISLKPPHGDKIADESGFMSRSWLNFSRYVASYLEPLGQEKYFTLVNNQAVAANITGLKFNKEDVSSFLVKYLIQRVTTGGGAVELLAMGQLHAVYRPTSATWAIAASWTPGPSASGITFSITSAGQVQYTSTNEGGTPSISKISYRVETFAAKNSQYSQVAG